MTLSSSDAITTRGYKKNAASLSNFPSFRGSEQYQGTCLIGRAAINRRYSVSPPWHLANGVVGRTRKQNPSRIVRVSLAGTCRHYKGINTVYGTMVIRRDFLCTK